MPSFTDYKKRYNNTVGRIHKFDSDYIMEETWDNDISAMTGYLYDWYHDENKTELNDMCICNKVPIDIKFLRNSSATMAKDAVTYHLQLRPSQECNVDYYPEVFGNRYGAYFPMGLYIDIPDSKDRYNRWLVVAPANYDDPQFPTFELLRCDFIFQYIYEGKKYNMAGVLRSQNSYNSGLTQLRINLSNCWKPLRASMPKRINEIC